MAAEDTERLRRLFIAHFGAPRLFQDLVQERLGGRNPFGNTGVGLGRRRGTQRRRAALCGRSAGPGRPRARQSAQRPHHAAHADAARDPRPDRFCRARERLPRDPRKRRHGRSPGAELQRRVRAQLSERARVPSSPRCWTGSTRARSPCRPRWPSAARRWSRSWAGAARRALPLQAGLTPCAARIARAAALIRRCPAARCSNPHRRSACGRRRPW